MLLGQINNSVVQFSKFLIKTKIFAYSVIRPVEYYDADGCALLFYFRLMYRIKFNRIYQLFLNLIYFHC